MTLLADLYIDTNDPTYLFNQGRCLEQNRRYEDAIGRFREYLIKAKHVSAESRGETERHIAACESYLRAKTLEPVKPESPPSPAAAVTPAQAPNPPAQVPTPPVVVSPEPEPNQIAATPEPAPNRTGSGLRVAGLVVGSLGAAGLVTGLILNLKANSMVPGLENEYDPTVDSRRKGYKTGAWIGYGAGAACLLGGSLLFALGMGSESQPGNVALAPAVGPDMTGPVLLGVF